MKIGTIVRHIDYPKSRGKVLSFRNSKYANELVYLVRWGHNFEGSISSHHKYRLIILQENQHHPQTKIFE